MRMLVPAAMRGVGGRVAMRVGQYNILMQAPDRPAGYAGSGDVGMTETNAAEDDAEGRAGVSVFRPGQPLPRGTMMIEAAAPRAAMLPQLVFAAPSPIRMWEQLGPITPDPVAVVRNNLFPAHGAQTAAFDLLRTRLLQAMAERSWQVLGIAGVTAGAGASFTALNLGFSLARLPQLRAALVDLDLQAPQLAGRLGVSGVPPLADVLSGAQPFEGQFCRFGANLALGLNGAAVADAGALLSSPATAEALAAMTQGLQPDIVVADLPPVLAGDAFAAALPLVDAVLLVVDATATTAAQVRAAEARVGARVPLMGTILNRTRGGR